MKHDYDILVANKKKLFEEKEWVGFKKHNEKDYEKIILRTATWMKRYEAETNFEYKQPICYCVILNPETKKIFAYKRANRGKTEETRLNNNWSIGIGGHVEKTDSEEKNPLRASMMRELLEEAEIKGNIQPKILGYINTDKTEIDKVHFGIIFLIETDAEEVLPKADEIAEGKMMSYEEFRKILYSENTTVESWSKIAFEELEKKN